MGTLDIKFFSVVVTLGQTVDQTYRVERGSTVVLPCVENTAGDYPAWSGPPVSLNGVLRLYNMAGSSAFFSTVVNRNRMGWGSNKMDLVLSDVAVADGGIYTCAPRGYMGTWIVQLIVRGMS